MRFVKGRKETINKERGLKRNQSGVAAVEFALVGPLFFALVFSMLEIGYAMTRIALVESAVSSVRKEIYIGSNRSSLTQADLEEIVCKRAKIIRNCEDNITVEVNTVGSFATSLSGTTTCRDSSDKSSVTPSVAYNPGRRNEVVIMRACVTVSLLTPALQFGLRLPENANGNFEIVAITAFQNEP